ncbi:CGNR zinc finger domain-containing protein [Georgenia sp. EYE_87]|uniref:CGNR zinc finger domain-containing protein n=1 Tax=Georgenia sp. EYE_87 TaxID=2853448 RepID=UPI0020068FB3|nr:CGNR zinc finger domain-containing protein [Georgenia sp. EYE_87]MCK6211522.1 CGNR zinc finger domain-containing protein [Georgenia sp. EYE_87]
MVAVPRLDIADVVDLVNHYAVRARAAAGDEAEGYRPLREVLAPLAEQVGDGATEELQVLADAAYEVFVAAGDGRDVAPVVNALLAPAGPTPVLAPGGDVVWEVPEGRSPLRGALGVTLLDWVHTRGAERLGVCGGRRCADAFADSSPAGRRKFCSATCLNRHKVAEHRRRAAALEAP